MTVFLILDGEEEEAPSDTILVADEQEQRLIWIPVSLWVPDLQDTIDRAFAKGGSCLLIRILSKLGLECRDVVCIPKSRMCTFLCGISAEIFIKKRITLQYLEKSKDTGKHWWYKATFVPPKETLSNESAVQWFYGRSHAGKFQIDNQRIKRQQILFRVLLDTETIASDIFLPKMDGAWKIETLKGCKDIILEHRHVTLCRYWTPPPIQKEVPEMAVVIISVGAPPELTEAIRSILRQSEPVEIAVVNSGGGDIASRIPIDAQHVKVRSFPEIIWAGAARNYGITMTSAPYIAFLASDCEALPHWIENRMQWHRAGVVAVASSVVTDRPKHLVALASHLSLFSTRLPGLPDKIALRYGASYSRSAFYEYGLFAEDLRIGEDSEFHHRIDYTSVLWEPNVKTLHRTPKNLFRSLADQYRRGVRFRRHWYNNTSALNSFFTRVRKIFSRVC